MKGYLDLGRRYVGRGVAQLRRLSVRVGGGIMGWMLPYVEGEGWNRRRYDEG